jgi:lysophospholipase
MKDGADGYQSVLDINECAYFTSGAGISIRYCRWPASPERLAGTVILLGGRKEFLEKYAETAGDLNRMGFDVYSFDWRGQGLSTRLIPDRSRGFIRDYEEYLHDMQVFCDTVIPIDIERPVYLLAHSMGGHLALRYLRRCPTGIDGAILSAPMIDIRTGAFPNWLIGLLIRLAVKTGRRHAVVPGSRKRAERDRQFAGNPLTSDPIRFQNEKRALAANPALVVEAVTFAWLAASMKSIGLMKTPGFLEAIHTPVLMVGAGDDRIVSLGAQKEACARMPNCRMLVIPDSRHEILMEKDTVRASFWKAFRDFTDAGLS